MIAIHPYVRYAQALIMCENKLSSCEDVTSEHIIAEIENGLNAFRVQPAQAVEGKKRVKFGFVRIEMGDPKKGIFLAPNVITKNMLSRYIWREGNRLLVALKSNPFNKLEDISTSVAPIAGEYLSFSLQNKIGRGKPKILLLEKALSAITTLTRLKPCLQYWTGKKGKTDTFNACIIPDLPIAELKNFIEVYKRMLVSKIGGDLMYGNVVASTSGKGIKIYEAKRPLLFKGNFPNPPKSSSLGCVALLGAIGELGKEAEHSELAMSVLESLKHTTLYLVIYGDAATFTYNHYVIDLSKEGKLKTIVDSLYCSQLYRGKRLKNSNKNFDPKSEYQKFDFFTSRFLQLFNHASFKDFLSFRAEYPENAYLLFNTYFIKMEKIDPKIVSSARALGKWLNKVAYFAAKVEVNDQSPSPTYWEELRRIKAKVLIDLESSTFSAKSGDALIAQAVTKAGRLSGLDAPESAALFMETTASGELPLNNAKNLLIAFSRLINKTEQREAPTDSVSEIDDDTENHRDV